MISVIRTSDSQLKLKAARTNYISKAENNIISDSNCFWNYAKSFTSNIKSPREIKVNNKLESDPQIIADGFADFYSSVFVPSEINISNEIIPDCLGKFLIPDRMDIIRYCLLALMVFLVAWCVTVLRHLVFL